MTWEPRRPRDLEDVLDREEIRNLLAHYAYAVDAKDWTAWSDLLTDDVRIVRPSGSQVGKARIVELAAAGDDRRTLHVMSGTVVDVDGDRATARAYLRRISCGTTPDDVAESAGVCSWSLRREDGAWRIAAMEYVSTVSSGASR